VESGGGQLLLQIGQIMHSEFDLSLNSRHAVKYMRPSQEGRMTLAAEQRRRESA